MTSADSLKKKIRGSRGKLHNPSLESARFTASITYSYWTLPFIAGLSILTALYLISVRQIQALLQASFGFLITQDTLAFHYSSDCNGLFRDLHPSGCMCARHTSSRVKIERIFQSLSLSQNRAYGPRTRLMPDYSHNIDVEY